MCTGAVKSMFVLLAINMTIILVIEFSRHNREILKTQQFFDMFDMELYMPHHPKAKLYNWAPIPLPPPNNPLFFRTVIIPLGKYAFKTKEDKFQKGQEAERRIQIYVNPRKRLVTNRFEYEAPAINNEIANIDLEMNILKLWHLRTEDASFEEKQLDKYTEKIINFHQDDVKTTLIFGATFYTGLVICVKLFSNKKNSLQISGMSESPYVPML